MATYEFTCHRDGVLEQTMPLGQAPPAIPCPECGDLAKRRFSMPQLRFGDSRARRLIAATEATSAEPAVVGAPMGRVQPGPSRPRRPMADPRTAKLPRP